MAEGEQKQLVFLVSQPRAGSTMLQKMIGAHSEVCTVSEPWVLLHPLSILRDELHVSRFGTKLFQNGFEDFLKNIPDGKTAYVKQIGEAYRNIYFAAMEEKKKQVFLDKTPRYYYIIEELLDYFPDAKIILLVRNPAAVLASILETWVGTELHRLAEFKGDLLDAPDYLLSGLRLKSDSILKVQYEELLKSPEEHYKDICRFIGIPFEEEAINFGSKGEFWSEWNYGDQDNEFKKSHPDEENIDRWHESLKHPVFARMIMEYVEWLGADRLRELGYSDADFEVLKEIDVHRNRMDRPFLFYLDDARDAPVEVTRLKNLLKQKDETLVRKNSALLEGDRAREQWRTRSLELDEKVSALDAKLAAVQLERDQTRDRHDQVRGELEALQAERDQASDRYDEMRGKLEALQAELDDARVRSGEMQRELEKKNTEYAQIENSVSFKLGRAILSPFRLVTKGK